MSSGKAIIITSKQLKTFEDQILDRLRKFGVELDFSENIRLSRTSFRNQQIRATIKKLAPFFFTKKVNADDYYTYWILHHWSKGRFREFLELWQRYGLIELSSQLPQYALRKKLENITIRLVEEKKSN